jgi:uncharacterized protein (TIGR03083 family)
VPHSEVATTISTATVGDTQNEFARSALRSQRQRLAAVLRGLADDAWTVQSRCTEWSVHEVVRHLCDVSVRATAILQGEVPVDVDSEGVDPRTAPVAWLADFPDGPPQATCAAFEEASAEVLGEVDRHVRDATGVEVPWFYGPVPWSIAALHLFWDAWVHERDILVPLRRAHESPTVESRAAATYGLTMGCLPAIVLGAPLDETVVLSGNGGGMFRLHVHTDRPSGRQLRLAGYRAAGNVTITAGNGDGDRAGPQPLRGRLVDVIDSLVGRGADLNEVLHGPPERVERLGMLRAFMLPPVA